MTHAGEVRHDGEAEVALEEIADLRGALARAAAGAVGHGHKIGRDTLEHSGRLAQGLGAGVVPGRKKFQRTQGALVGKEFGNRPVGRHGGMTQGKSRRVVKRRMWHMRMDHPCGTTWDPDQKVSTT